MKCCVTVVHGFWKPKKKKQNSSRAMSLFNKYIQDDDSPVSGEKLQELRGDFDVVKAGDH
jgi:hypothetical protein